MKIINSNFYKLLEFYNNSYTKDKEHSCRYCLQDLIASEWKNCIKSKNIIEKKHYAINLFMRRKGVLRISINWEDYIKYFKLVFKNKYINIYDK